MKRLANENLLLKNTGNLHEIASLKHSKVKMRSAHRKREKYHKSRECALKRSNAFLSEKVCNLELENEALRAEGIRYLLLIGNEEAVKKMEIMFQ